MRDARCSTLPAAFPDSSVQSIGLDGVGRCGHQEPQLRNHLSLEFHSLKLRPAARGHGHAADAETPRLSTSELRSAPLGAERIRSIAA